MDFESSSREGFKEEQMGNKGKLPFSYSSSSSTSSSSHQYKTQLPPPLSGNSRWEPHQFHDGAHPNWLSNRYEPEEDKEPTTTLTAATASTEANSTRVDSDPTLELMSTSSAIEREPMFDKVVTPSDVGKLNRLVIPKQHAEKYFPLDSSSNEKGLLLNFEDRNGKPWRFRYSYWNSSQSYVMTKGWSRFVKDKKLDAGDIVSFQRGVGELGKDRLFIDWRRRPDAVREPPPVYFHPLHRSIPWSPMLMPPPQMSPFNRNGYHGGYPSGNNVVYLRSAVVSAAPQMGMGMMEWRRGQHGGGVVEPVVSFDSVAVVQGKAAAKRLRLFGVNMDCPISESDTPPLQPHQLSSSQNHQPLQVRRLFNGIPLSTTTDFLNHNKGKSSMSLDLDI